LTEIFLLDKLSPMHVVSIWFSVISDLFINLAAGWFGAVIVVPITSQQSEKVKLGLLTTNLLLAILSLVIAFKFKELSGL